MSQDTERTAVRSPRGAPLQQGRSSGGRWLDLAERYGLLVLFAVVVVFFATFGATGAVYLSPANLSLTFGNQVVTLLVALALIPVLVSGYFDLSVGATTGLSAVATAAVMSHAGLPPAVGVLAGITVGGLVGVINATLVVKVGINPFIATLAMATVIAGTVQWYTEGLPIQSNIPREFSAFGSAAILGIPYTVIVVAVVAAATWYLLGHTVLGRHLQAVGSNASAARLIGIPVQKMVAGSFIWSGLMCGLAGVLLAARTAGANPTVGPDYLFPAFAAVFLGASAVQPGKFNVIGTVIGLYFLAFTISGISLAGADAWVGPFFNGVALLVAVSTSMYMKRRRLRQGRTL